MENNYLIPIGKRIAEVRRSHNVTQEVLADKLNVSLKHISHIECGTSGLSLKNLIEFCNLFHCSLDYIIFGKSQNTDLEKLPDDIVTLLNTGTEFQISQLNRYLEIYIELLKNENK